MYVTGAPISGGDWPVLHQTWEAARSSQQAVDSAVAEKHRVFLSEVLVDPYVVLILSLVVRSGVNGIAVRRRVISSSGRENGFGPSHQARINQIGRDAIPGKWIANVLTWFVRIRSSGEWVVDLTGKTAQVSAELSVRWYQEMISAVLCVAKSLVGKIKKCLVLAVVKLGNPHGAAEGGPELILAEYGRRELGGQKCGACIESIIPNVFPGRPVILVGAGLGDHVDHATEYGAELSAIGV